MDTISRENNPSILPIAGLIAGALALVLSIVALVKLGAVKKLQEEIAATNTRVESAERTANAASESANRASTGLNNLAKQVQGAFDTVTAELNNVKTEMNKIATKAPAPKAAKEGQAGEPRATGPGGDYTIKAGDGLAKIAKANGVSLDALEAANPGVDSRKLKIGQKLVIPKGR